MVLSKTSLVIVIFELRVMTYVVSFINCFELNWFVRFVSYEVWSDKRFVMWHFRGCWFLQIQCVDVITVTEHLNSNPFQYQWIGRLDSIRNWNQLSHRQGFEWNAAGKILLIESWCVVSPVDITYKSSLNFPLCVCIQLLSICPRDGNTLKAPYKDSSLFQESPTNSRTLYKRDIYFKEPSKCWHPIASSSMHGQT